jgi:hypothetical protein
MEMRSFARGARLASLVLITTACAHGRPLAAVHTTATNYRALGDLPASAYVVTDAKNGNIFAIKLRNPLRIDGKLFGTHGLWLWNTGHVRGGTILEPIPLPGSQHQIPRLTTLFFHVHGAVRRVTLPFDATVYEVRCLRNVEIVYRVDGKLARCGQRQQNRKGLALVGFEAPMGV